jgi:hypothetical protein
LGELFRIEPAAPVGIGKAAATDEQTRHVVFSLNSRR